MQIGNNRPNGPQPSKNQGSYLDPDLTRANRDGIDDTTRVSSAKTQESIENRSPERAAEARKTMAQDSFQRSRPEEDPGQDVGQRIKNARAQAGAKRIQNGRGQNEENVRSAEGAPDKAQRIASARAQQAEAQAQRVGEARRQDVGAQDNTQRVANARGQQAEKQMRTENARGQSTEAAQSQRVENARTQYLKTSQVDATRPTDRVRSTRIDAGNINLPGRSGELPGVSSSRESGSVRAVRIANIRKQYAAGELNTPQRADQAASRLLGGE